MTDSELVEALAAALRAYATAPLSDCEVHEWAQLGMEDADGSVVVNVEEGEQEAIAIGEQLQDALTISITGTLAHADTQASRRNIVTLREQIVSVLRQNRTLTAGGENARTNGRLPIRWTYPNDAEGERWKRHCVVMVTYEKTPDAAS